jgi:hypothetical protein
LRLAFLQIGQGLGQFECLGLRMLGDHLHLTV